MGRERGPGSDFWAHDRPDCRACVFGKGHGLGMCHDSGTVFDVERIPDVGKNLEREKGSADGRWGAQAQSASPNAGRNVAQCADQNASCVPLKEQYGCGLARTTGTFKACASVAQSWSVKCATPKPCSQIRRSGTCGKDHCHCSRSRRARASSKSRPGVDSATGRVGGVPGR